MKDEDNNRGGLSSVEAVPRAPLTASWWRRQTDSENLSVQAARTSPRSKRFARSFTSSRNSLCNNARN